LVVRRGYLPRRRAPRPRRNGAGGNLFRTQHVACDASGSASIGRGGPSRDSAGIDRDFQTRILPLAQRASGRFPLIVAREGADYFSWRAAWFQRLESELAAELDSRGS
jgi:hypothetical protein